MAGKLKDTSLEKNTDKVESGSLLNYGKPTSIEITEENHNDLLHYMRIFS